MNERRQDFELLQRFTREGEQSAFADVVRRHLDLVFATALRKVEDAGAAQEVAQNVFAALARKAWQFAPDDSLPAWLHKAALLESKSWLRGELGRRRREEVAATLGTTMKASESEPAFQALVPLLDEALLSLREKDRTALLLRFSENQSLRDVGAAFGITEDTARKRVQSALEKLAEFFKRRGFKTASVAAAAAALQHTAATTTAAVASTVVSSALQAAPPVLVGLAALLARLMSMSRVQTAAVCVIVAAVPAAWQLNERHAAGQEVKRLEAQQFTSQNQAAGLQAELARAQAEAARLEQSVAEATEAAARAAFDAQAFADWKQRIRRPLLAADYRWDDDSAFVRIPKAILPELSELSNADPFAPPGVVHPYARELLALTPAERQTTEATLQRHFAEVEEKLVAGIYETNAPGRIPDTALASTVFVVPSLTEDELTQRTDQMLAEVRGIVGEERWQLIRVRLPEVRRTYMSFNLRTILTQPNKELRLWVESDEKGTLMATYALSGSVATSQQGDLAMFLPAGHPNRTELSPKFGLSNLYLFSAPLRQRALGWLEEQATARLGKKEQP